MPVTALMTVAASDTSSVNCSADTAWRLLTALQNASSPPSVERATTAASGSRTMRLSQSVETPSPRAPGLPAGRPRRFSASGGHPAVDTPASSSISAIEPPSMSNISSLTFSQPPRSSIVNSPGGSGNWSLLASRTVSLTGR